VDLRLLAALVVSLLALAYALYGRLVARQCGLDDGQPTPAVLREDGVDFVPAGRFYLFGQHFSAIAAAGPIVGPILACLQFGWLPCILWVGLGVVFIGAVHDFSALFASVRHGARSVAEIAGQHLSRRAWLAIMAFIWIALLYVITAFTDVTAGTFVGRIEELEGVKVDFERGGAVAFSSIAYLFLAILMGIVERRFRPPLSLTTAVFVPATLGVVWLGTKCSTLFALSGPHAQKIWGAAILGYCFFASLLPLWLLLQPRGYLGGFVLYLVLAIGTAGIFLGGFPVEQPAWRGFRAAGAPEATLFPFLFVTIACGACSGFHGLVCGGTTSKQIAKESHCRPVGYGAMLLEGFVALIALATIMTAVPKEGTPPGAIYGQGIGRFLAALVGEKHLLFAIVFGSMAFSTFVFDTLDVSTRLGRYILQELFDWRGRGGAVLAALLTIAPPFFFLIGAEPPAPGRPPAYMDFWLLFGTSNQLLAGLTLLAITVWLWRSGRSCWFTLAPMAFIMVVTLTALAKEASAAFEKARATGGAIRATALANGFVACALLALAALLLVEAALAVRRRANTAPAAGA
jgi:carbon starvation protein